MDSAQVKKLTVGSGLTPTTTVGMKSATAKRVLLRVKALLAESGAVSETPQGSPLQVMAGLETVDSFIRQCKRNGKALKIAGSAILVECRDAETAAAIAAHKETGSLCLPAGTKSLVVRANQLDKFRERVRLLGYGIAQ